MPVRWRDHTRSSHKAQPTTDREKEKSPEERPPGFFRRPVANRWGFFSPTDLELFIGASPVGGSRSITQSDFQDSSGLHNPSEVWLVSNATPHRGADA